ncbi:hypothetical protein [Streptomyces tanashiensis]|uniref:hypothetical protein n=1 Tax=Streptomyces tanashiensis TaxID=67367 RepID=UPI0033EF4769
MAAPTRGDGPNSGGYGLRRLQRAADRLHGPRHARPPALDRALRFYNHNGEESLGCCDINSGSTTYFSGWWWPGDLTVKAYNSHNCENSYSWGTHVAVPYFQSGDWTYVTGY